MHARHVGLVFLSSLKLHASLARLSIVVEVYVGFVQYSLGMFSATYIRFFLLVCFISCIGLSNAKDDFAKRGLAYGNWSKSDVDIWDAQKSPLTWYYNVSSVADLMTDK